MSIARRLAMMIVASSVLWPPRGADGALLAYDAFDYAPAGSDLLGNAGGSGFATSWRAGGFNASNHSNYDIQGGSLSFGGLRTNGNRVQSSSIQAIGGLTRDFNTPLGAPGTTRYISFLLRPEGTLNAGAFNGFLGVVIEQPLEPELFIGKPGGGAVNRYVMEDRGGAVQTVSTTAPVVGETVFFVLKAVFATGNDQFTLFVNPVPGAPEPVGGLTKSNSDVGNVAGLTIYSTGAFSADEFRLGETFADVTPIPEPAAMPQLLLLAVGVSFLARQLVRKLPSTLSCDALR